VTTLLTLLYLRYSFRARIASKYPRHKLADDGTRIGAGQAVITPKLGKAEAIAWFRDMEELGLVENFDQFKNDLVVQRNASDRNRLDFVLPPDIVNPLTVTAARVDFRV
jgi:phage tail sheath gpL-like